MSITKLYTEKFRPKNLDQIILPERIRKKIENGLEMNYLLEGKPGVGKTSLAKVLAGNAPTLYINCSDERGIDTIREKITDFCSTKSLMGDDTLQKVIIMDEIDGAGDAFFKALRATMERFHFCRFIATCNYLTKIPDPMLSRFRVVEFSPENKEEEHEMFLAYSKRVNAITKKLGIEWESMETLREFVKRNFPDLRTIITKIQDFHISGIKTVTTEDVLAHSYSFIDVFEICAAKPDPAKNYTFLMGEYSERADEILASLGSEFPKWLMETHPEKIAKMPQCIIAIARYQEQRTRVIQPQISMLACVYEIQTFLNN